VFKIRVEKDLSYAPGRLKEADEIAENRVRRFIKSLIRERHSPKKSDLSPVGEGIGQAIRGFIAARSGDLEETEKSVDALNKLSLDPHYKQRILLNEALSIADKIKVNYLFDFYEATKTSSLVLILPGWRNMIQSPELLYRKVKDK